MASFVKMLCAASLLTLAGPALATQIPSGTVSAVALFNPAIVLSTTPATYSATDGGTFEISGSGGFFGVAGTTGTLNGTISFSKIDGIVLPELIADFFVFSDAHSGVYDYSVTSVQTNSFINDAASKSGTLYVLGTLIDKNLGFLTPTPASLSIQFNSTGPSAYSSALTLAVPPSGAVPEPATWGMMVVGAGLIGLAFRRRRQSEMRSRFA